MAKVKSNDIIEGLSGKLGKQLVIRHMRDGRTFVLTAPDFSNRKFSEEQITHQTRFQQAAAYARMASKTNPVYAKLAAGTPKNAYNFALSDWFHPPVIHSIRRQNERILVNVTDNVLVAQVLVKVLGERGEILEQGQAVPGNDSCWEYTAAANGKVLIEAKDLAGNITSQETE